MIAKARRCIRKHPKFAASGCDAEDNDRLISHDTADNRAEIKQAARFARATLATCKIVIRSPFGEIAIWP